MVTPPAIINAFNDAFGTELTDLPLTPEILGRHTVKAYTPAGIFLLKQHRPGEFIMQERRAPACIFFAAVGSCERICININNKWYSSLIIDINLEVWKTQPPMIWKIAADEQQLRYILEEKS